MVRILVGGAPLLVGSACVLAQPASTEWQFSAGLGVASQPKYPGSADTKLRALPLLSASYGRFFIGGVPGAGVPAGVGAYLVDSPTWRLGVGLRGTLDNPRKESDSPRLWGLGDIDRTALGSVFGSYNDRWFSLRGAVLTDIGGHDQGTRITLDLEGRYPVTSELTLTAGPGLSWADSKYTRTFFGVTAAQSARSALPVYHAGSGLNAVSFGVGANYRLTPRWGIGARVGATSLRGDAADSPITEKKTQTNAAVLASYRFCFAAEPPPTLPDAHAPPNPVARRTGDTEDVQMRFQMLVCAA